MKNIGIFITKLTIGGAEKQSILLAKILNDTYHVHFILHKGNHKKNHSSYLDELNQSNVSIYFVEGTGIGLIFRLIKLFRTLKIHVLFTYLPLDNIVGAIAARIAGVKGIVGGIRNSRIPRLKYLSNLFIHHLLQTKTVFNNISGRDYFVQKKLFSSRKSIVISNCIVPVNLKLKDASNNLTLLNANRFVHQKGIKTILKALAFLVHSQTSSFEKLNLIIAGYGPLENEIRTTIKKLKLEANTQILIKPENLDEIYQKSTIYVSASYFEGISNSILEAMNYAMPIIATDVGDNARLIENNSNGFLFQIEDYKQLATHIRYFIENPSSIKLFGENSHRKVFEQFSTETFKQNYIDLIENLF